MLLSFRRPESPETSLVFLSDNVENVTILDGTTHKTLFEVSTSSEPASERRTTTIKDANGEVTGTYERAGTSGIVGTVSIRQHDKMLTESLIVDRES